MTDPKLTHLDERGELRMVDVDHKDVTSRRAVAEAFLEVNEPVMRAVREGTTPKGDLFAAARLAGIAAAKRTSELIPLCHSIPLSQVVVEFEPLPASGSTKEHGNSAHRIRIIATAAARARTGVEMEALTAVTVAALTLYDMLKALSHDMVITHVRLLEKTGGASGYRRSGVAAPKVAEWRAETSRDSSPDHPIATSPPTDRPVRAAVVTVSDRCSTGALKDTSGPAVGRLLEDRLRATVTSRGTVPDDADRIAGQLEELCASGVELITTVGGTGCGSRDVTPEATRHVIAYEVPGLAEAMRASSLEKTPFAALQRGICGIRGASLIVNLPGNERAAVENLTAILPVLPHALELIRNR